AVIRPEWAFEGKIPVSRRECFHLDRSWSGRRRCRYGSGRGFLRRGRHGHDSGKENRERETFRDHDAVSERCGALAPELPMLSGNGLVLSFRKSGMIMRKNAK